VIRLAIGCVLLLLALGDAREAAARPSLSDSDVSALKAGKILFRPEVPAGRNGAVGMGGTALAYLQSDPDAVWEAILDFAGHPRFFPRVRETRVIERVAGRTLVSYRIAVGPFSFRFFVNNYADAATHFLRWELDRSRENDLFRDHWGYWKVDDWDDGALVTYAMAGQTTLPAFMIARAGRDGTVETVKALKVHVEQRAGL